MSWFGLWWSVANTSIWLNLLFLKHWNLKKRYWMWPKCCRLVISYSKTKTKHTPKNNSFALWTLHIWLQNWISGTAEVDNPTSWLTGTNLLNLETTSCIKSLKCCFFFLSFPCQRKVKEAALLVRTCFIVNDIYIKIFLIYPCFVFFGVWLTSQTFM